MIFIVLAGGKRNKKVEIYYITYIMEKSGSWFEVIPTESEVSMALKIDSMKLSASEDMLRQVKGVVSAKVLTDSSGQVSEVHVLTTCDRNPKQVVRDIESVFLVSCGLVIDHKKISVAQLSDKESFTEGVHSPNSYYRPRISGVTMLSAGRMVEARVLLQVGKDHFEGYTAGPGTASNRLRLVSQATLMALEKCLEGAGNFLTEDVSVITVSGSQAVICSVTFMTNAGEERLIGAAFVKNDVGEATVKATLSAINRRLDMLLK